MPYWENTPEVVRGTWCWRKTSRANMRVMAPGRVAPGGVANVLISVQWQAQEDSELTHRFVQDEPAAGEIGFVSRQTTGEGAAEETTAQRTFPGGEDVYEVVEIRGTTPSGGAIPDVILPRAAHFVYERQYFPIPATAQELEGRRQLTLVANGERRVVRVERELRTSDPTPENPENTRRLHPPITNRTHYGAEIPVQRAEPTGNNVLPHPREASPTGDE